MVAVCLIVEKYVGTYIIHVDSVPGYLAEWYNQAGVWQDATEIELSERGVSIEVCPRVVPEDISSGDISISGTVYDVESGSETAIEGVSVVFTVRNLLSNKVRHKN